MKQKNGFKGLILFLAILFFAGLGNDTFAQSNDSTLVKNETLTTWELQQIYKKLEACQTFELRLNETRKELFKVKKEKDVFSRELVFCYRANEELRETINKNKKKTRRNFFVGTIFGGLVGAFIYSKIKQE